ncbi:MAG: hypothetical protein Q8L54_00550 [Devosia sp.]|nr:hypothetical protein [Devosia sp.]
MRFLAACCLFVLGVLPAPAARTEIPGYGVIEAPRDTDVLSLSAGDMRPLEPFFAPELVRLLHGAERARVTGIPWQGHIDRPPGRNPQRLRR